MSFETQNPGDEAKRDDTATESPGDEPSEEESGGPYGNPAVDEESLRKQQEESRERRD
jgi:hypothetical protein